MIREVKEETNLDVTPNDQPIYVKKEMSKFFDYLPMITIVYKCTLNKGEITLSNEHTEYIWTNPQKTTNMDLVDESKQVIKKLYTTTTP